MNYPTKSKIKVDLLELIPENPWGSLVFDAYREKTGDDRRGPVRMAMLELIERGDVIWGRDGSLKLYEERPTNQPPKELQDACDYLHSLVCNLSHDIRSGLPYCPYHKSITWKKGVRSLYITRVMTLKQILGVK